MGNLDREGEEVRALRTIYRVTSSQLDGTTTGSFSPWLTILTQQALLLIVIGILAELLILYHSFFHLSSGGARD